MIVLKKNSKLGRAHYERTGTTRVGQRHAEPKSANDRKSDADAIGFDKGAPVRVMAGPYKGRIGVVRWTGHGDRGGGPRLGLEVTKGADWIFVDADDVIDALKPIGGRQ